METPKEKGILMLGAVTTLLSLLAPGLYLLGYFYEYGYFDAFKVSIDYFPRTTEYYFVSAFKFFLGLYIEILKGVNVILIAVIIGVLISIVAVLIGIFLQKQKHKTDKIVNKIRGWKFFDYISYSLFTGFLGFAIPYILFVVIFLIMLIPIFAYTMGMGEGNKAIASYKKCNTEAMTVSDVCTLIYDKKNNLKLKGLLIGKAERYIAIYDGEEAIIYPTDDHIVKITRGKSKSKHENQAK